MRPIGAFLAALEADGKRVRRKGTAKAEAQCPAHDDRAASLSIAEGEDGRALIRCHAGCSTADVVAALGFTMENLFPPRNYGARTIGDGHATKPLAKAWPTLDGAIEAARRRAAKNGEAMKAGTWVYTDVDGTEVAAVVRFNLLTPDAGKTRKSFRPLHRAPGGWALGDPPVKWPLYCLPTLAGAERVYVCEGEKAADAAASVGLVATTSAHGAKCAGKSDWTPLATAREIILLPDHDDAGEAYVQDVAALIRGANPTIIIRIVRLADLAGESFPKGGDIVDFVSEYRDGTNAEAIYAEMQTAADRAEAWAVEDEDVNVPPPPAKSYVPFPINALPSAMAELVRTAAKALGCDAAQIALPMLVACSAAVGNSRRIILKSSWIEPAVLWGAVILPSGSLKSPAMDVALEPIRRAQHEAIREYQDRLSEYQEAKVEWEAAKKNLRGREPTPPVCRRFAVSDATIEALGVRLAENPRGLLLERDELAGWFGAMNQYRAKGGADEAHWLTIHRAATLTADRKTGDIRLLYVPRAFVSLIGTIQPGTLRRALSAEYRESGLAARLLLAMPPTKPRHWSDATVSEAVARRYAMMVAGLLAIPMGGTPDDPKPIDLHLTAAAKAKWVRHYDEWNASEQAREGGDISAAWAKLEGCAARLALIIHCCRAVDGETDGDAIDETSMAAGIALARWFGGEAERVYAMLSGDARSDERLALAEFIDERGGRITARELARSSRRYRADGAARNALSALVEAGHGRWVEVSPGSRGGRPVTIFEVTNGAVTESKHSECDDTGDGSETPSNLVVNGDYGTVTTVNTGKMTESRIAPCEGVVEVSQ